MNPPMFPKRGGAGRDGPPGGRRRAVGRRWYEWSVPAGPGTGPGTRNRPADARGSNSMIEEFRHGVLREFSGLPVFEFGAESLGDLDSPDLPPDVENWAWRVAVDDDEGPEFAETFAAFTAHVDAARVRALIIGLWFTDFDPTAPTTEAFATVTAYAKLFPALEALFVGDVSRDRSEVSWLHISDPAPLLEAFPRLRRFGLRGTTELSLGPVAHEALEELTFQGGGLPPEVVRALGASRLPALTGLDLYLGTSEYNGGAGPADLEPILSGSAFPLLRHLGLRDAENADEIAAAVAHAPVVARLESLDLSLGTLTDEARPYGLSGTEDRAMTGVRGSACGVRIEVRAIAPHLRVLGDPRTDPRQEGSRWPQRQMQPRRLRPSAGSVKRAV